MRQRSHHLAFGYLVQDGGGSFLFSRRALSHGGVQLGAAKLPRPARRILKLRAPQRRPARRPGAPGPGSARSARGPGPLRRRLALQSSGAAGRGRGAGHHPTGPAATSRAPTRADKPGAQLRGMQGCEAPRIARLGLAWRSRARNRPPWPRRGLRQHQRAAPGPWPFCGPAGALQAATAR